MTFCSGGISTCFFYQSMIAYNFLFFSKIFPVSPSSTNLNAGSLPRRAMVSSQKRLKEARARQAHHQTAEPPQ